jgi:mannose-6-phosphate isomerase-like protein (cupin superfamily)
MPLRVSLEERNRGVPLEIRVDSFELSQLLSRHQQAGRLYLEFLRVPSLSLGLYVLPAGGSDPQGPHAEDEVYHVLRGRGFFRKGDEDFPVGQGSIVFVKAGVVHRFHTITEDLTILVFFAPAENTQAGRV